MYNRVQFYTTKQIIDKVEQDSLYHFDYKISESDVYFCTAKKPIKVVDFDPFVIYLFDWFVVSGTFIPTKYIPVNIELKTTDYGDGGYLSER